MFYFRLYSQVYSDVVSWLDFMAYCRLFNAKFIFYGNNQFYFKQFSLEWVHSLFVKNISISNYSVYSNSSNSV